MDVSRDRYSVRQGEFVSLELYAFSDAEFISNKAPDTERAVFRFSVLCTPEIFNNKEQMKKVNEAMFKLSDDIQTLLPIYLGFKDAD